MIADMPRPRVAKYKKGSTTDFSVRAPSETAADFDAFLKDRKHNKTTFSRGYSLVCLMRWAVENPKDAAEAIVNNQPPQADEDDA